MLNQLLPNNQRLSTPLLNHYLHPLIVPEYRVYDRIKETLSPFASLAVAPLTLLISPVEVSW